MGRLLFFLLLGVAIYVGYTWWLRQKRIARRRAMDALQAAETMVRCEVCGLNLPQSDALPGPQADDGAARWFCGEAHRTQGPR